MKENVLDVLMYLFETYVDTEEDPEPDQNELRAELSRAGFADAEIERALEWLDGLTDEQHSFAFSKQTPHGTRIYNEVEESRLDVACRGYIAYLEQIGILSPLQREILVDRLLALDTPDIEVEQTPKLVNAGHDPQLEAAVEKALEMLKTEGVELLSQPPDPVRTKRPGK